ncbi:MAG: type II toxin-antitoxin system RelE/ParE family toxin [Planctomycetota bacterium]
MSLGFTELPSFMRFRDKNIANKPFFGLQMELMADPEKGDVMPGCGGFRKVRLADEVRGKGKRGGIRIIYLYVPEVSRIVFILGYAKNLMEDLSAADKKALRERAAILRLEEIRESGGIRDD